MRHFYIILWGIMILVINYSCCPKVGNKDTDKFFWKQDLASYKWIYWGLSEIYVQDNIIVCNTTISSSDTFEDNRLCGLDANTGEIKWMYPIDKEITSSNFYNGIAYQYQNLLVVPNQPMGLLKQTTDIVCIDILNGKEKWKLSLPQNTSGTWLMGKDEYAYFISPKDGKKVVHKLDVITGDTSIIYTPMKETSLSNYIFNMCPVMYGKDIVFFQFESSNDYSIYRNYMYLFDIECNSVIKRYELSNNKTYGIVAYGLVVGNYVYIVNDQTLSCFDLTSEQYIWVRNMSAYNFDGYQLFYYDSALVAYFPSSPDGWYVFDAINGHLLYSQKEEIDWLIGHNGYVYMKKTLPGNTINVVSIKNGNVLDTIICPETKYMGLINSSVKGVAYNDKLYFMSYTTAYCHPTYPW